MIVTWNPVAEYENETPATHSAQRRLDRDRFRRRESVMLTTHRPDGQFTNLIGIDLPNTAPTGSDRPHCRRLPRHPQPARSPVRHG
jgi:hypothetical protein